MMRTNPSSNEAMCTVGAVAIFWVQRVNHSARLVDIPIDLDRRMSSKPTHTSVSPHWSYATTGAHPERHRERRRGLSRVCGKVPRTPASNRLQPAYATMWHRTQQDIATASRPVIGRGCCAERPNGVHEYFCSRNDLATEKVPIIRMHRHLSMRLRYVSRKRESLPHRPLQVRCHRCPFLVSKSVS